EPAPTKSVNIGPVAERQLDDRNTAPLDALSQHRLRIVSGDSVTRADGQSESFEIRIPKLDVVRPAIRGDLLKSDPAEHSIVEDDHCQRNIFANCGEQFEAGYCEATIAEHGDDGALRHRQLCTDRRREAEPHRLIVAWEQETARSEHFEMPAQQLLMQAGVRAHNALARHRPSQCRKESTHAFGPSTLDGRFRS